MSQRVRRLSFPRDREGPSSGSSSRPSRSQLSLHGSSPIEDIAGTSQMGTPQHQDALPSIDNACDGSGDDEIEHERMSVSSQSEMACLRPWTPSVSRIPLPEKAIELQKKCDMNYKLKRDDIKRKECAIKQRLDKAMSDLMREKGQKDYEKPGRHGSEEKTKVPPKGYRGILEWKDNIPVGDWAVRFNNLIGCLIRDPRSINIAHNFEEQEFKCIKKIWEKLMVII
ncbi:uncharacterized protein LOC109851007 isoform X1 [Asparagus officinalis]|uniref:uncharacterized protein LOC109851007 isoform X1 n=1 Tax=Asparagus officinalis TaxID=4686 RepID=UPI00098E7447|nr:uncharacterized protein LOC109851007 isoform X1 [Asparagus officinalis]